MLKKILQLIVVLLFTTSGVMAQTVEIDNVTVDPGAISVPLYMNNFTGANGNVGAITLYIEFDNGLLSFSGIDNALLTGIIASVNNNGTLVMTWSDLNGTDIDGKLLDLKFDYSGGFNGAITFKEAQCEIANGSLGTISASYVAGSVTQDTPVGSVSLDDVTEYIGNTLYMPITIGGAGFTDVDAITLIASYDETQLNYLGLAYTIPGMVGSANNGTLTLTWTGTPYDFSTPATFAAVFAYAGGEAEVNFLPGCEISSSLVPLSTEYINGTVSPEPTDPTLTLGEVAGTSGTTVTVPITASGFGGSDLGAISLNLAYHNTLVYTGHANDKFTGMLVTANSNHELSIEWSNLTAGNNLADGDVLMELKFTYTGGLAPITFDAGSLIQSINLINIPTTYVDGFVDVGYSATFTIVDQDATPITDAVITFDGSAAAAGVVLFSDLLDGTYAYSVAKTGYKTVSGDVVIAGGNVTEPIVLHVYSVANLKAFLQGAYNGSGGMTTNLNSVLPLTQPYSGAPWNYAGTETVTSVPATAVDWVLIELRTGTAAATKVATRAGFLLADGSVVDTDGASLLEFIDIAPANYYIVVKHRFHLAIMSATAQALSSASVLYDFTLGSAQSYGVGPLKDLTSGVWGLYSGDGNADGHIFPTDVTLVYLPQANSTGYFTGDWNMDTHVFPTDVTLIYIGNANKSTRVPN